MPGEPVGGLKATAGKGVTTLLSLYPHSFSLFSVSFSQSLVFSGRLCSKPFQHILDIVGLSEAELWSFKEHIKGGGEGVLSELSQLLDDCTHQRNNKRKVGKHISLKLSFHQLSKYQHFKDIE